MPIANYTTSVEALKTASEVQRMLVQHGAKSILTNYDKNKQLESLSFMVDTPYGEMPIRLPVNAEAVLQVLRKQEVSRRYANYEQAVRIAWRIIRDWVRAQMAILETEMVRMEQVFLPYMVTKDNVTLYEAMVNKGLYLSEGRRESDE